MLFHKARPVDSFENLRDRIERLFKSKNRAAGHKGQLSLDIRTPEFSESCIKYPKDDISEFLDLISDAMPDGDMYLFGGVIRDIALFGKRGFSSDVDIVVEGDWKNCINYLQSIEAKKNKFGGYRLNIGSWPVDIWNARETWAIKEGFVKYEGIHSLTNTTVLNWDAILMNWRTKKFICKENYIELINNRILDIVLEENPNPLGMAVRVFRHLCIKDASKISLRAALYLANCTEKYSYDEISKSEFQSYGNIAIEPAIYKFFHYISKSSDIDAHEKFRAAEDALRRDGMTLPFKQKEWEFGEIIDDCIWP